MLHYREYKIILEEIISLAEKKQKKVKSPDPMPPRTKKNIDGMLEEIESWGSKHKEKALEFSKLVSPKVLFEILHGIRRWYNGQTMGRLLLSYRKHLKIPMELEPEDVIGIYRGFKVPKDDPIAKKEKNDEFMLKIERNKGLSSWTTTKKIAHRFSGKSKDRVGVIVQLIGTQNVKPVLAPSEKTENWFNSLYEKIIGTSFRKNEKEYLLYGSPLKVKIVEIKK